MLVIEGDGLYAGWVNVWGDWAAHLSYTTSLAYQDHLPPELPIYAGHVLSYPFAADLLSAILIKFGLALVPSMLIPSFILSIFLILALFYFFRQFLASAKEVVVATFLFLFNGGLGFLVFFQDIKTNGLSVLSNLPREYTHVADPWNLQWINIITSEIVPQRGFLLGLPLTLIGLAFLWQIFTGRAAKKKFITVGVILGLVPLAHMHSFLVLAGFSFWVFVISFLRKRPNLHQFVLLIIPALVAIPIIKTFYPQVDKEFLIFKPGWLAEENIIFFWIKNAGVSLLVSFLGIILLAKKKNLQNLFLFSLPFWIIFIAANLFLFQPFAWDNTKMFTYWWLWVSIFGAMVLTHLLKKQMLGKTLFLILFVSSIMAGFLDVIRITQYDNQKILMINSPGIALSNWAKENTLKDAVFLTAPVHDHPIPVLSGRSIAMGFPGWLWTYGINADRAPMVEKIYSGSRETFSLLRKLNISYVVIGDPERSHFSTLDEDFFNRNFPVAFFDGTTKVYQVIFQ